MFVTGGKGLVSVLVTLEGPAEVEGARNAAEVEGVGSEGGSRAGESWITPPGGLLGLTDL